MVKIKCQLKKNHLTFTTPMALKTYFKTNKKGIRILEQLCDVFERWNKEKSYWHKVA